MSSWETVIGLEVHVQLNLKSKLFSSVAYGFGGEPNSRVSVVDMGLPGVLPVLNKQAIKIALRAAIALEGEINQTTTFDRKNYFYPDLPKGYQISQFNHPYCIGGRVPLGNGKFGELERIHMEEDAGKSMHSQIGSMVDLNRAGSALVEIVGKPDLRTPADAHAFLDNLKLILQYAGVSDCDMEKGSLRCDGNISMRPKGSKTLGTKAEIKNLNSFKMVQRSLEYEERRQIAILSQGGQVAQETRLWNDEKGVTATMRSKESAQDYRYFPEPDLPPLHISDALINQVRESLPELPLARRQRWIDEFKLPEHDAHVLTADRNLADYFEDTAKACGDVKTASNWVMSEVLRTVNDSNLTVQNFPIQPERLAGLIQAIGAGKINRNAGKKVFQHMLEHDDDAAASIQKLGLQQISDPKALQKIAARVMQENPKPVEDYRNGKEKALHALKGLVMRETQGKANPSAVQDILVELLNAK